MEKPEIIVKLTPDQALVLSDWLERVQMTDLSRLIDDASIWAPLHRIAGTLDKALPEIFAADYADRLEAACRRLRPDTDDAGLAHIAGGVGNRASCGCGQGSRRLVSSTMSCPGLAFGAEGDEHVSAGDWAALAATAVAVVAAVFSLSQARSAKVAADTAKEQLDLSREQMRREEVRDQEAANAAAKAALLEAEKVKLGFEGNGGSVVVEITNGGTREITNVELLNVRPLEAGPWTDWTVNRNISAGPHRSTTRDLMRAHEKTEIAVWLLDGAGNHLPQLPETLDAQLRFRDADGQWWLTSAGEDPQRVQAPSS